MFPSGWPPTFEAVRPYCAAASRGRISPGSLSSFARDSCGLTVGFVIPLPPRLLLRLPPAGPLGSTGITPLPRYYGPICQALAFTALRCVFRPTRALVPAGSSTAGCGSLPSRSFGPTEVPGRPLPPVVERTYRDRAMNPPGPVLVLDRPGIGARLTSESVLDLARCTHFASSARAATLLPRAFSVGRGALPCFHPWPCSRAAALYPAGWFPQGRLRGVPAAFAVFEPARHPEFTSHEASSGRSLVVAARALAHPADTGLCRWASPQGSPLPVPPKLCGSTFSRFGTFTLWFHGQPPGITQRTRATRPCTTRGGKEKGGKWGKKSPHLHRATGRHGKAGKVSKDSLRLRRYF